MTKKPFVTKEQLEEIAKIYPTPFHIYDERGIRENVRALKEAFSWNKGYKEYFAVKATPNPFLIQILREYGCGCDCSSYTELMMSEAIGAVVSTLQKETSPKMKYGTGILTASIPMDLILVKSLSVMYSERWILILAS